MVPWDILIFGNLGIALVAGSAAAMNHLMDVRIDTVMARTRNRPMVLGKVSNTQGAIFIGVTGVLGMAILAILVNPLTAWLNLASWVGYGIVYTVYLKRATPQNIVIGGIFGAAPPLFGWITAGTDYLRVDTTTFLGTGDRSYGGLQKSRYSNAACNPW
jgi:protoheme IX farnesyltransferase